MMFGCLITVFSLSLACYDIVSFAVLVQPFIGVRTIKTNKTDSISQIYQIMVVRLETRFSRLYADLFYY